MNKHIRQTCKIANSDDGMDKLMEYTLQRQMVQDNQIAELTAMLKQVLTSSIVTVPASITPTTVALTDAKEAGMVNTGPIAQQANVVNNVNSVDNSVNIKIRSWKGEDRVVITTAMLTAAFTENPRLKDYCRMSDEERVDAEKAAPYVVEALMDLLKRAHADPAGRNVYLNPKRADQVLVFDEVNWQVITLIEAIEGMFNKIAERIHEIMITDRERTEVPMTVQASASWIPNLYNDEPGKHIARAKAPMAAHLANMANQSPQSVPSV
jgi:hypothetical protein